MDRSPDKSLWERLKEAFHSGHDSFEQAVLEARDEGELEAEEGSMILSILRLDELQVQDIMTPRTDFDCVAAGASLVEVASFFVDSGHSRLPVYKDTRDNIVGIAYAKDLLRPLLSMEEHSRSIDSLMREPFFVPETKLVSELLQEFRGRKNHMAIAVDEYGGTSGLVTIEDVLEVIVGEIEDEHDAPREEDIKEIAPGQLVLSGRAFLEDLAAYGLVLTAEEVDTIGGYLCLEAGHVPCKGEEFFLEGWTIIIEDADLKQILRVTAKKESETGPS